MFKFEFQNLYGVTKGRAEKFSIALNLAEKCVNSDEFKNRFISTAFTQLGEHKDKTNQELLNILRQAIFLNYAIVPRPWYKRYSSVVGWTMIKEKFMSPLGYSGMGSITTYEDEFDRMSIAELASHLAHEGSHCPPARFEHYFNWSKARDLSLPYAIGAIIFEMISKGFK